MVTIVYGLDGGPGIALPPPSATIAPPAPGEADAESREWLRCSRADRDVLRTAHHEVACRRTMLPHLRGDDLDDIACEPGDDAPMSVLALLQDSQGHLSRFTTWVYELAHLTETRLAPNTSALEIT